MYYSTYQNGTEAWYADQEAKKVKESIDQFVSTIDDLESSLEEVTEERDDIQAERDQFEERLNAFKPEDMIDMINKLENAAAAVVRYCVQSRITVREAFDVQESDSDSESGTAVDGAD